MGWNEPPDKDKNKDPWSGGGRGNEEGPPDIEEIIRKMQQGLGGLFGRRKPTIGRGGGGGSAYVWLFAILIVLAFAAYDMVYFVNQQERGIVLRFGAFQRVWQPGLNVRLPWPIESTILVNVEQQRRFTHKALMLTQDENIVDVEEAVQWKIRDPKQYEFNVYDPDYTLRQVTESAIREVIGKSKLDYVLTEGRSQIAQSQLQLIQETLDKEYKSGIQVLTVQMQAAKPPDEVKAAFDDAIKSREDEQRSVNEAEAYRNDIIPRARGAAARIREEANGYKQKVIAEAEGDASRFTQMMTEYQRAPNVTRERLYLDSLESVLSSTSKVLLDAGSNNSLMYLPLDKMIQNKQAGKKATSKTPDQSEDKSSSQIIHNIQSRSSGSGESRGTR